MTTRAAHVPQYIVADEVKLRQVLLNLMGNAIKFTDAGHIHVRLDYEPPRLIISVEDTGPGMTDAELSCLFEPFVQTSAGQQSQQGSGLGLSISRQYVHLMGGDLQVQSQVGQGTTFVLDLRIALANRAAFPQQQRAQPVRHLAAEQPEYRILIVEDHGSSRQFLTELLVDAGFAVKEATNGREAVDIWQAWRPHLIWMDMQMPVMDGCEATRQIKAHADGASTVILALTANLLNEARTGHDAGASARATGYDDVVLKPVQADTIFDKMAEHLHVRYTYHTGEVRAEPPDVIDLSPARELLADMPEGWITALQHAARSADAEQITRLCQDIPETEAALNEILTHYVQHFRFDQITALTQQT